jgi:hypothetical protein
MRRRIASLGTIQVVVGSGVLAVLDHEVHAFIRSWPQARPAGAVTLERRDTDRTPPAPTSRNTTRATR